LPAFACFCRFSEKYGKGKSHKPSFLFCVFESIRPTVSQPGGYTRQQPFAVRQQPFAVLAALNFGKTNAIILYMPHMEDKAQA